MRTQLRPVRLLSAALGVVVILGFAAKAPAETIEWSGTFELIIGDFPVGQFKNSGTGVSTVTTSGGAGAHLDSLRMSHGLTITGTLPLTDPENASLVTLIIDTDGARIGIPLGRGTFAPISGGGPLTDNQLTVITALPVRFKQCINFGGPLNCSLYLPIPITRNGTQGAGIGGTPITINTFSNGPGLKLSILGNPWTLGAAVITGIPNRITHPIPGLHTAGNIVDSFFRQTVFTPNGLVDFIPPGICGPNNVGNCTRHTLTTSTRSVAGFVHGPVSATSLTATFSGVIQLVTPTEISTSLDPPNQFLSTFVILTLHSVPEPGLVLLLGSGVAGLVLLGRHRMRK